MTLLYMARSTRNWLMSLVLGLFLTPILPAAQWTSLGPEGGDVRSLASDPGNPDRIFLGTSTGVLFVSQDGGHSGIALPIWAMATITSWTTLASILRTARESMFRRGAFRASKLATFSAPRMAAKIGKLFPPCTASPFVLWPSLRRIPRFL